MLWSNHRIKRGIAWLMIGIILNLTLSCRYYTYSSDPNPTLEKIDKLKNSPNYLIIHQTDQALNLKNIKVDNDSKTLSGVLQALPPEHLQYLETKPFPGSSNHYRKKSGNPKANTPQVVNEVHLYVKDLELKEGENITIPMASIEKIEVYDPDTGATTASFVLGGVAIAGGVSLIIVIIIILTKSSCPFVYVDNGDGYVFAGEIFSGAIFKSIERDDFLLLPVPDSVKSIEINISNKLKEKQFINQVKLLQVSHPAGTEVLPDRLGNMHLIANKRQLLNAQCAEQDVTPLLKNLDDTHFTFNSESGQDYFNEVVMTFPKPTDSKEGHLILNAKNSLWGDYLFGEFTHLFGKSYSSWIEKQNKKPRAEASRWAEEQGLAMKVFVEENNQWKYVDRVDLVGPLAFRNLVVPIDLNGNHQNSLRIKISAAFMMWDVDYLAMDYSSDEGIDVKDLPLSQAITNEGINAIEAIARNDNSYLNQLNTGEELHLSFPNTKPSLNKTNSFVLYTRGYYQHVREYTNDPEIVQLIRFRSAGRFSQFSKEKFDEINRLMESTVISSSTKMVQD